MENTNLQIAFLKLQTKLDFWVHRMVEMIPNFIIAIVIILLFNLLSKLFVKNAKKLLSSVSDNQIINDLIIKAIAFLIMSMGVFIALGVMDLDKTVTSLLAGIGILGLALSFAFQHMAANLLSGLIISLRSTVKVGDLIRTNTEFGNVINVGLRSLKIINVKGQEVEVPNRLVLDNAIIKFSKTGFRRIDIKGKINFSENLTQFKEAIEKKVSDFDFLFIEKKPNLIFGDLTNEKVDFTLRVWMNFTNNDGEFLNAKSQCLIKLNEVFIEKKIESPITEVKYIKK